MSDILDMTLASLAEALKEKKISAAEAAGACLDRMEATEPRLRAMLHIDREGALAQARAMDAKGPEAEKPLWGVPVTVKVAKRWLPRWWNCLALTRQSRLAESSVTWVRAFSVFICSR